MKHRISKLRHVLMALCLSLGACHLGCAAEAPVTSAATAAPEAPAAPKDMRLFLLIGQSNMAGRGKIEPQDEVTNPRIWVLNKEQKWVLAKDPLHFDKPAIDGVGLGSEFARTILKSNPGIAIGLIPCAFGGTTFDQWKPGGELYKNALARTREAMKNGTIAGILWHQGEGDSRPEKIATYPARFKAMITQLRHDIDAPQVPVVVGELGRFRAASPPFNAMLPELIKQVLQCALATAEGLEDKGDKLHFNSVSLREFGKRYAAAYLRLQTPSPPVDDH